ncbi:hypothetical protein HK097_002905, partial [Rhizophlyctis rosea]
MAPHETFFRNVRSRFTHTSSSDLGSTGDLKSKPEAQRRCIHVSLPLDHHPDPKGNEKAPAAHNHYPPNKISTSKYTPLTFVPKNLLEQFRRVANVYFLITVILQIFPMFGTASPILAAMPMIIILSVTAIRDGFEDWKRHREDNRLNTSVTHTLNDIDDGDGWKNVNYQEQKCGWWKGVAERAREKRRVGDMRRLGKEGGKVDVSGMRPVPVVHLTEEDSSIPPKSRSHTETSTITASTSLSTNQLSAPATTQQQTWTPTYWSHLRVGDFVLLRANDPIPADVLIVSTSDPDSVCYIETKNLDGETNLKSRECARGIWEGKEVQPVDVVGARLKGLRCIVEMEDVGVNLYNWDGVLKVLDDGGVGGMSVDEIERIKAGIKASKKRNLDLERSSASSSAGSGSHSSKNKKPTSKPTVPMLNGMVIKERKDRLRFDFRHRHAGSSSKSSGTGEDTLNASEDESSPPSASPDLKYSGPSSSSGRTPAEVSTPPPSRLRDPPTFKSYPISIQNILLRGSILRTTEFVVGIVLATGPETKMMLNQGKTPSKRSRIEKKMNGQVALNFIILFAMCAVVASLETIYTRRWKAMRASFIPGNESLNSSAFYTFWASLIMLQNIVPISLYITVEGVKTIQAYFIYQDVDMYDEETDQTCTPKTWNIADDLGQIEYVFSDKTGTLTQNKMTLLRCSINGHTYGQAYTDVTADQAGIDPSTRLSRNAELAESHIEALRNIYFSPFVKAEEVSLTDSALFESMSDPQERKAIEDFFLCLSVCHTVLCSVGEEEILPNGRKFTGLQYTSQSPDEHALVMGARDAGFAFVGRQMDWVKVDFLGRERMVRVLNILEFSSVRKRMSVVCRVWEEGKGAEEEGEVVLFVKGADSVIWPRLLPGQERVQNLTFIHLSEFATEGLRTLCIASRRIPAPEYQTWSHKYHLASTSLTSSREDSCAALAEELERDLTLLGATAIEDKLQERVGECVEKLREAGIKVWVLTGDKMETAVNVGFAARLLSADMEVLILKGDDVGKQIEEAFGVVVELGREGVEGEGRRSWKDALWRVVEGWKMRRGIRPDVECPAEKFTGRVTGEKSPAKVLQDQQQSPPSAVPQHQRTFALVIEGDALHDALASPEISEKFLKLGTMCKSVICCRVSPKQKAQVVRLVKRGLGAMCLSIGDGANDVSMIQEAHIGVGIYGREGLQAAMASDYVISQFRFLAKLVLVHGQWSYYRTSEAVLTFFYKNMVWVFALFWYQIYCGFTADILYDYTYLMLYNLLFTSLPSFVMGIFDQCIDAQTALAIPQLHRAGINQTRFTTVRFLKYVAEALYQSAVCFYSGYFLFQTISPVGFSNDNNILGTAVAMFVIVTVNASVGAAIKNWTFLVAVVVFGSIASFFIY